MVICSTIPIKSLNDFSSNNDSFFSCNLLLNTVLISNFLFSITLNEFRNNLGISYYLRHVSDPMQKYSKCFGLSLRTTGTEDFDNTLNPKFIILLQTLEFLNEGLIFQSIHLYTLDL